MAKGFDSKEKRPGRLKPTYHPSGHGTYNCRWRKEERREAAVARQKALCDPANLKYNTGRLGKEPMDWRNFLPEGER